MNPYYLGGSDDLNFENEAELFILRYKWFDYLSLIDLLPQWHNSVGYVFIISIIMRVSNYISEYHTMIPRLINAYLVSLTSLLIYNYLFKNLKLSSRRAVFTSLFFGISPIIAFNSAHIFRDVIIALLLFILFLIWEKYCLVSIYRKINYIFVSLVLIIILMEIRDFAALFGGLIIFLTYFIKSGNTSKNGTKLRSGRHIRRTMTVLIFLTSLAFLFTINSDTRLSFSGAEKYFESYSSYRIGLSDGYGKLIFNSPLLPFGLFFRIVYLTITPLPVPTELIERNFLSMGTFIQILLIPFFINGVKSIWEKKTNLNILMIFGFLFLAVALTTFTDRHILMFYPFFILILGVGFKNIKLSKLKLAVYYLFVTLFLSLISLYNL